jgi:hypothetical protein
MLDFAGFYGKIGTFLRIAQICDLFKIGCFSAVLPKVLPLEGIFKRENKGKTAINGESLPFFCYPVFFLTYRLSANGSAAILYALVLTGLTAGKVFWMKRSNLFALLICICFETWPYTSRVKAAVA